MIGRIIVGIVIIALMVLGAFAYGFMLADWDGEDCEPSEHCKTCPFPCEHNKRD